MSKRALTETSEEGAAPSPTVLYSYWRSSCSWRVRIGLQFKGIAYEYSAVNLLKSEQTSAEYAATKNPMKAVPTLVIDGLVLTQSGAILEYLEETRPEPALMPKEPAARFQVWFWLRSVAYRTLPMSLLLLYRV